MTVFADRRHAGRLLATRLHTLAGETDLIVLGLPRGGIPVAFEVATAFDAPLDVFAVRKIGAPGHEELAIGALASGGIELLDHGSIRQLGVSMDEVRLIVAREREELERREHAYRDSRPTPLLEDRTVVLVDDGLATGTTMLAAVKAVRARGPRRVIVAVPVASLSACELLRADGVECHCLATPEPFLAVGAWYRDFTQTTDDEVRALLREAAASAPAS
jgi:putative phosphoribosyl transferase